MRTPHRIAALSLLSVLALAGRARADVSLANGDGWEVYTSGRLGVFVEALKGGALPQAYALYDTDNDPSTPSVYLPIHPVGNGGIGVQSDPVLGPDGSYRQGPVFASRVRSGFLGNILGVGMRRRLTERTTLSGFVSIWGTTETDSRRTWFKNVPDMREAYTRVEGPAGTVTAGRALSLFSRGAVEIDFLYGHGFGVGNPAGFDEYGPSAGHIGYGVLAPVFVGGVTYATPRLHGLQLTVGYFDPASFVGLYWTRTKFGRPEAEATFDSPLGQIGKLHLFANGAFQKVYATDVPRDTSVYGAGGGGRLELGRFHLGVAGHYGQGLGIGYALDGSDAVLSQFTTQQLRKFSGLYAQAQVVLGSFDVNGGWGVTRVEPLGADTDPMYFDMTTMQPQRSFLKQQMGISGVVVYHVTSNLHLAFDYFNSNVKWQQGETQTVHSFNVGSTLTW